MWTAAAAAHGCCLQPAKWPPKAAEGLWSQLPRTILNISNFVSKQPAKQKQHIVYASGQNFNKTESRTENKELVRHGHLSERWNLSHPCFVSSLARSRATTRIEDRLWLRWSKPVVRERGTKRYRKEAKTADRSSPERVPAVTDERNGLEAARGASFSPPCRDRAFFSRGLEHMYLTVVPFASYIRATPWVVSSPRPESWLYEFERRWSNLRLHSERSAHCCFSVLLRFAIFFFRFWFLFRSH